MFKFGKMKYISCDQYVVPFSLNGRVIASSRGELLYVDNDRLEAYTFFALPLSERDFGSVHSRRSYKCLLKDGEAYLMKEEPLYYV